MAETLPGNSFVLKQSTIFVRSFFYGTTAQTVAVSLSKNGAAFAGAGGAVAEIANGWYSVTLNPTDTNTIGILAYHATAASGGPADFCDYVQSQILPDLALNPSGQVLVSSNLKQNQPFSALFFMTQIGTTNPAPGLMVTGQRTFGVAGFSNVAGAVAECGGANNGGGWYVFSGLVADSANAVAGFKFSSPGANDTDFSLWFQP
jgi:hypothetical protein